MNNLYLFIFVFTCIICKLMGLVYSSPQGNNLDIFKKEYGDGYGTEWIYFADGGGNLHHINLSMTMTDGVFPGHVFTDSLSDEIEFRLYNGNDSSYILLDIHGRAVNDTEQDVTTNIMRSQGPLKLITHGWLSSADIEAILNIKNAYLEVPKVNVITIDWSYTASSVLYVWVAKETKKIGGRIASFLDGLNYEYNVTGDQLHLIGHSLGAHVMGIAASTTNSSVHRVTGLDPARPFFEYPAQSQFDKLDSSDAEIVDVIHTCAGLLGYEGAVGTVDFYPNKGVPPQPGCDVFKFCETCSHSISFNYFLESIKDPTIYPAYECESWQDFLEHKCNLTGHMGEGVNKDMRGTYYLTINATEPLTVLEYE